MGIREKIRTLQALRSTLNVWEVIAVNRYRKYSSVVGAQLPYFLRLQEVLEHLYALYPGVRTDLLQIRDEKRIDLLVLTSDRGYVGDFITRTIRFMERFMEYKRDREINLFIAGRRGASTGLVKKGAVVFEDVLTKDVNWEVVGEIRKILVERYRNKFSDACYVIFQRPEVEAGEFVEIEEREKREALLEESPFFYPKFEDVLRLQSVKTVERGRFRPIVTRFLPADIRKRYSKEDVLNIEVPEDELVRELLELYLDFFMREVFLEHFTSINFARYRTISRILENIDKKLKSYKRLVNKLRQEKITGEIEDIVSTLLATEEKRFRTYEEKVCTLEVDVNTEGELVERLRREIERLGFNVGKVERRRLIGGFKLLLPGKALDLSVIGSLGSLKERVRLNILRREGW